MSGASKESPTSRRRGIVADRRGKVYEQRRLDAIAARWDTRAESWDSALKNPDCHLNEDESYARFLKEALAVIKKRGQICAEGGIIDVGCGTGLVLEQVASHFAWGVGIDISRKMIQLARRKRIPNARFLLGDAFSLSGACPGAAAILSRGVLVSHYGHRQGTALLKELRAALGPGGFLIVDFLNLAARNQHEHVPETKTYFDGAKVCQMAKRAGFASVRILGEMERRVLLLLAEVQALPRKGA